METNLNMAIENVTDLIQEGESIEEHMTLTIFDF
jgi:hypothetical protein